MERHRRDDKEFLVNPQVTRIGGIVQFFSVNWPGLLILGIAAAIRLPLLNSEGFWYDEIRSIDLARQPWSGFWHSLIHEDVHPPLFFLLLKGWGWLFGWSESAARMLPLLISLLTLQVVLGVGKKTGKIEAAWFAGAYLAVSPMAIRYSLEVRPYAALMLVATLAIWVESRWLERAPADRRHLVEWLVVNLALPLIHYAGGIFFVAKELVRALSADHPSRKRQAASCATVFLLFLAWIPFLRQQVLAAQAHPLNHLSLSVSPLVACLHFSLDPMGDLLPGVANDLLIMVPGILTLFAFPATAFIPGTAWLNLLGIWFLSFVAPLGEPRNLIGSLPLFALSLGLAGETWLKGRLIRVTLVLLLGGALVIPGHSRYRLRPDFRPLAAWTRAMEAREHTTIPIAAATEEARRGMSFYLGNRPVILVAETPGSGESTRIPDRCIFVRHAYANSREAEWLAAELRRQNYLPEITESLAIGQTEAIRFFRKGTR